MYVSLFSNIENLRCLLLWREENCVINFDFFIRLLFYDLLFNILLTKRPVGTLKGIRICYGQKVRPFLLRTPYFLCTYLFFIFYNAAFNIAASRCLQSANMKSGHFVGSAVLIVG